VPLRCEVRHLRGATVINDTYNANPASMRAALELFREFDGPGRRIVVCGDMADLGEEAAALHWELGRQSVEIGEAAFVIACGEFARHVAGGRARPDCLRSTPWRATPSRPPCRAWDN